MNVEINLLPIKAKQNRVFIYSMLGLIILLIGLATTAYFTHSAWQSDIDNTRAQIANEQLIQAEFHSDFSSSDTTEVRLERIVSQLEEQRVPIREQVELLARALPVNGRFQTVSYTHPGNYELIVQFDSQVQSTSYLAILNEFPEIENAMITLVELVEDEEPLGDIQVTYIVSIHPITDVEEEETEDDN